MPKKSQCGVDLRGFRPYTSCGRRPRTCGSALRSLDTSLSFAQLPPHSSRSALPSFGHLFACLPLLYADVRHIEHKSRRHGKAHRGSCTRGSCRRYSERCCRQNLGHGFARSCILRQGSSGSFGQRSEKLASRAHRN